MGPRSFNRGNLLMDTYCTPQPLRFNGAAVFQPRKYEAMAPLHTQAKCFNGAAVFQPWKFVAALVAGALADAASMGPRSFNRGNQEIIQGVLHQGSASMGPRSFNRGNQGERPSPRG